MIRGLVPDNIRLFRIARGRRAALFRVRPETLVTFCKESHEVAPFPRTFREPTGLSGWRTDWRQGAQGLR